VICKNVFSDKRRSRRSCLSQFTVYGDGTNGKKFASTLEAISYHDQEGLIEGFVSSKLDLFPPNLAKLMRETEDEFEL
jgi:hypothetical protein